MPSMPAMPAMPAMPSMPAMPAMPSLPAMPELGADEAAGRSNLMAGFEMPVEEMALD